MFYFQPIRKNVAVIIQKYYNVCTGAMVTCLVRMFITFASVSPTLLFLNLPVSFDSLKLEWWEESEGLEWWEVVNQMHP